MKAVLLPAAAFALAAILARSEEPARGPAAKLLGTWTIASGEKDGQKEPAERLKGTEVQITKDTIIVTGRDAAHSYKASYKLDLKHRPHAITMKALDGPDKGKPALGIFQLEGDTLKLCYALPGERSPEDFTTRPGSRHMLFILKRAK
jgi:uncharacterized protein (TIGR03067 family)